MYDVNQFFPHIFISLKNHIVIPSYHIWFLILSLKKKIYEWMTVAVSSSMTQYVTVTFVNSIWLTTIFECLLWAIWMEMWTRRKTTYSSLQLHPSSWITYYSHHKCGIEASLNSLIEFWVYDFWRYFSRAR